LDKPVSVNNGTAKYSLSLIIRKDDKETIERVQAAIAAAYQRGKEQYKNVPPLDKLRAVLKDGDEQRPDDEAYKNAMFLNALAVHAPGVVDARRNRIDPSEVYAGSIVRASLNFYYYDKNVNRGVACGLNNVQKVREGTPLAGPGRAEDDFNDGYVPGDGDEDFLG